MSYNSQDNLAVPGVQFEDKVGKKDSGGTPGRVAAYFSPPT